MTELFFFNTENRNNIDILFEDINQLFNNKAVSIHKDDNSFVYFLGDLYDINNDEIDKIQLSEPAKIFNSFLKNNLFDLIINANGKFISVLFYNNTLFIVRDKLGIKTPIFYNNDFFGTSLNKIKSINSIELKPDFKSISNFLYSGFILAPQTPFEGINKLCPGEYLIYDYNKKELKIENSMSFDKYINKEKTNLSIEEAIKEYSKLHNEAILKRIEGKNSIGILLSGGYDSGGNLYALREVFKGNINAYSIGFEDNEWSESHLAELMSKEFNANFTPFYLDGSEIEYLPQIIKTFEEPFFENGLLLNYKIASSIPRGVDDVILGGDGNDQFFGTTAREIALLNTFNQYKITFIPKLLKKLFANKKSFYRLNFHINAILNALELQHFGFSETEIKKLLKNKTNISFCNKNKLSNNSFNYWYNWKNFNIDILQSAAQVILYKASRITSSVGINNVFPFADLKVLEFIDSLPVNYKIKGSKIDLIKGKGVSKYIFKEYLKPKLPKEITKKKKQGGFAPLGMFLNDKNLRDKIYPYIKQTLSKTNFFEIETLEKNLKEIETTISNNKIWFWHLQKSQAQLMSLLVLSIWWEQYFENKEFNSLSEYLNSVSK